MLTTVIALSVLSLAVVQCVRNLRREARRPSRRLDPISDEALTAVLSLFPVPAAIDACSQAMQRCADVGFVDSIVVALEDRALTATQIRRLFNYTYWQETDEILKRHFGWLEAVREHAEQAAEKVQIRVA